MNLVMAAVTTSAAVLVQIQKNIQKIPCLIKVLGQETDCGITMELLLPGDGVGKEEIVTHYMELAYKDLAFEQQAIRTIIQMKPQTPNN